MIQALIISSSTPSITNLSPLEINFNALNFDLRDFIISISLEKKSDGWISLM